MVFVYPHVEIGYEVLVADTEDAHESQWRYGKVRAIKKNAVDVMVFGQHGDIRKFDVRHVGDPTLVKNPPHGSSGVFRLAASQLQINELLTCQQTLLRRMDALEQTFRAVISSLSGSDDRPEPATAVIPRRGPGRPPSVSPIQVSGKPSLNATT
jgi:hypothetical protein